MVSFHYKHSSLQHIKGSISQFLLLKGFFCINSKKKKKKNPAADTAHLLYNNSKTNRTYKSQQHCLKKGGHL